MSDTAQQFHIKNKPIPLSWYFSSSVSFSPCPGKSSDSQNALEDLAHYEFLAHLRKASTSVSHLNHNGAAAVYHPGSRHDELPPAIWSPGAQHRSPEGAGRLTSEQLQWY